MSELPYYITWCKQKDAKTFPIMKVDGVRLFTSWEHLQNHEVIDMTSISYQAHFGHNHPTIIKKIKEQLDTIPMSSPKGDYPHKNETSKALLKFMNKTSGKLFYTSGGAETIENALKMARQITKKKIVLARSQSYHGATLGALTATGDWRNPPHQLPTDWVERIPEPDSPNALEETRQIIIQTGPENIAAFLLETITGGNGVIIPSREWWRGIQQLCDEFNIMLIMDEVVCGFYRTGLPFGYMHFDVNPDMICLAKGITGGMIPFGAVWTNATISEFYENEILCCGLTNYAHPLGMAALQGVLEITNDEAFLVNRKRIEILFADLLKPISLLPNVMGIRQIGHLAAIDLKHTVDWNKFFEAGIYLVAQTNRLILAPPLIIDESSLMLAMKKITTVLEREV